jgi:NADH:ubiquinone oxidoreductase subunit 6 (subunit J)
MKMEVTIMIVGISMFITGLIMFYSIEIGQTDSGLRFIKNTGTFIGLSGMGVTMAGILLYLINRNEAPIAETFEV